LNDSKPGTASVFSASKAGLDARAAFYKT
jgi:hypothetical protein